MSACLPSDALSLLERLSEIGAPTGKESARALFIQEWFHQIRPSSAYIDADGNVLVDLTESRGPAWLFDAHIDIVSPRESLCVRKDQSIWHCPGIYDNTAACVLLMLLAREMLSAREPLPFLFSFTTGEEGSGNLKGIRGLMARERHRMRGAFVFDLHHDEVTTAAVGSDRFRLRWQAAGGHSWQDFGKASAIHALGEWIASLPALLPWENGRLSYNVGDITGGSGVNVIASQASATLDLRSFDSALLASAVERTTQSARAISSRTSVDVTIEPIGSRPAGIVPQNWSGLELLRQVHTELSLPWREQLNSTNANAVLAAGIPATCTGIASGGAIHTADEWLDIRSLEIGFSKLRLLAKKLSDQ